MLRTAQHLPQERPLNHLRLRAAWPRDPWPELPISFSNKTEGPLKKKRPSLTGSCGSLSWSRRFLCSRGGHALLFFCGASGFQQLRDATGFVAVVFQLLADFLLRQTLFPEVTDVVLC